MTMTNAGSFSRFMIVILAGIATLPLQAREGNPTPTPGDPPPQKVRVLYREHFPHVIREGDGAKGFSVDLMEAIAERRGWEIEEKVVPIHQAALGALVNGTADIALGGLHIDSDRDLFVDYVRVYELVSLRTMVQERKGATHEILEATASLFSPHMLLLYGVGLAVSIIAGLVIGVLERRNREVFPEARHESVWWAGQTLLAHNCGSKVPSTHFGRSITLVLMIAGTLLTAQITAVLTTNLSRIIEENAPIETPADYGDRLIGTVSNSFAARWLESNFCHTRVFESAPEAVDALQQGKVDAVVYDQNSLERILDERKNSGLALVGPPFAEHPHAILLQRHSPLTQQIDETLLELIRDGTLHRLKEKWSLTDPATDGTPDTTSHGPE